MQIRRLASERGVSGRQLARDLGKKPPYISRRLTGKVEFSSSDLTLLANYFNVPVATFFGEAA